MSVRNTNQICLKKVEEITTRHSTILPNFSGLSIETTPVKLDITQKSPSFHRGDLGRVLIGYCGGHCATGDSLSHVFDAADTTAPICCLDIGVGGDTQPGTTMVVRKGGRQKLSQHPPMLIEVGEYNPRLEKYTYEALRRELQHHISLFRAVMRFTLRDEEEDEEEEDGEVDMEEVTGAVGDMASTVETVERTVYDLLLSGAWNVYRHNGSYREEVKAEDGEDVDDELYARWQQGMRGRSKAGTRIKPKNALVDAANYGSSMANQPTQEKEEIVSLIKQIQASLDELGRIDEESAEDEGSSDVIDLLVQFDDRMFDLHFWAIHQEDATPLLSSEENDHIDELANTISELEALMFKKTMGVEPFGTTQTARLQLLASTTIPQQMKGLEAKRLESILQYIQDNSSLQKRAAYRMDRAKRHKKRDVDSESASLRELQRQMEADRRKASLRAKNYVLYRRLRFQRKQIERYVAELQAAVVDEQRVTKPDQNKIGKLQGVKAQLESRIQMFIEPQRRARVASSAPRYKLEGRVKGGYLGKRDMSKRKRQKSAAVTTTSALLESQQRLAGLDKEEISRIEQVESLLKFLLRRRDDETAQGLLVTIVQLLSPFTGLQSGAVTRSDLPPEQALKHARGYVNVTTSQWMGRQDVDLIALYRFHRQHFEQLARLLDDWRKARVLKQLADQKQESTQRLQVLDERLQQLDPRVEPPRYYRQDTSDEEESSGDESESSVDRELVLRIADRSSASAQAIALTPNQSVCHISM